MAIRITPGGDPVFIKPVGPGGDPVDDLLALLEEQERLKAEEEAAEEAAAAAGGGGGGGGGGGPTGPIHTSSSGSSSSSTIGNTSIDIAGNTNIVRTGRFRDSRNTVRIETIMKFIDVPTAEKVLDDFETGFEGFLAGMRGAGLSQSDMLLAREDMGTFMSEFLGDLATRAANGEDVFSVVGVDANEQFLGDRIGGASDTKVIGTETTVGVQTEDEKSSSTTKTKAESKTDTTSSESSTTKQGEESQDTSVDSTRSSTDKTDQTTKVDETQKTTITTDNETELSEREQAFQIEKIFKRNQLDVVRKLSPGAFLSGRFNSPGQLATVLRSRAGRAAANRSRGEGVVSGARSV